MSWGPRPMSHPLIIMWRMETLTVVVIVVAVGVAAALAGVEVTRRRLATAAACQPGDSGEESAG